MSAVRSRQHPPERSNDFGAVVQLVRIPACHAGGRGFESRPLRQYALQKWHLRVPFLWPSIRTHIPKTLEKAKKLHHARTDTPGRRAHPDQKIHGSGYVRDDPFLSPMAGVWLTPNPLPTLSSTPSRLSVGCQVQGKVDAWPAFVRPQVAPGSGMANAQAGERRGGMTERERSENLLAALRGLGGGLQATPG
jgi:hypothetical protein